VEGSKLLLAMRFCLLRLQVRLQLQLVLVLQPSSVLRGGRPCVVAVVVRPAVAKPCPTRLVR
jgi:hypothetical protein